MIWGEESGEELEGATLKGEMKNLESEAGRGVRIGQEREGKGSVVRRK